MNQMSTYSLITVLLLLISGCDHDNESKDRSSESHIDFKLTTRLLTMHTKPEDAEVIQLRPFGQPSISLGTAPIDNREITVVTNVSCENVPPGIMQELQKHENNVIIKVIKDGYKPYEYVNIEVAENATVARNVHLIKE